MQILILDYVFRKHLGKSTFVTLDTVPDLKNVLVVYLTQIQT